MKIDSDGEFLEQTCQKCNQKETENGQQKRVSPSDVRSGLICESHKTCPEWKQKKLLQQTKLRQDDTWNHDCQSDSGSGIDVLAGEKFFEFGTVVHFANLEKVMI